MRKINVCVVLPEGYMPAYALVELGELIFYSIRELGYLVKLQFNNIEPDAQNILIGCHMLPVELIPQVPENTIVVNTEQIHSGVPDWNSNTFKWVKNFQLWDYSKKILPT